MPSLQSLASRLQIIIEHPNQLGEDELLAIFSLINQVRDKLLQTIATVVDIRQNYRPFLLQSRVKVDHDHFHVMSRTDKDELYERSMKFETDLFTDLLPKEQQHMTDLFTSKMV